MTKKLLALCAYISTLIPLTTHALVITDSLLFETSNQSMWSEGRAAEWSAETFLGTKWGTYAGDSPIDKSIGLDVGAASVRAGIKTSGEIGLVPWASASGGGVSIALPTQVAISLPDEVKKNSYFKVSTSSSLKPESHIVATAPNFKAGIDGRFNMDNRLYGEAATFVGCGTLGLSSCEWGGGVDADLYAGRFSLLGFDTTETNPLRIFGLGVPGGIQFDHQYLIHKGPPYIYDADSQTILPTAILGNIILHNLEDKTGGVLDGDQLSLSTYQGIFESKLSITGILETILFPGTPGLLRHERMIYENSIKDIYAGYTLADVSAGPIFGMQQDFNLDPNLAVRMEFDNSVTRLEWLQVGSHIELQDIVKTICVPLVGCFDIKIGEKEVEVADYDWVPVTYSDGIIEILLGEEVDLMFGDGFANLLSLEYFLDDPEFRNQTYATIDPALQVQLLCGRFTGLGELCAYNETFQTEGLAKMEVYSNDWIMSGFNSIEIDMEGKGPTESITEPRPMLLVLFGLCILVWSNNRTQTIKLW